MKISADEPEGKEPAADKPADSTMVTEASTEAQPGKTGSCIMFHIT